MLNFQLVSSIHMLQTLFPVLLTALQRHIQTWHSYCNVLSHLWCFCVDEDFSSCVRFYENIHKKRPSLDKIYQSFINGSNCTWWSEKGTPDDEPHGGLQQCQCYGSTWNTPSAALETMAPHEETVQAPYSLCVSICVCVRLEILNWMQNTKMTFGSTNGKGVLSCFKLVFSGFILCFFFSCIF